MLLGCGTRVYGGEPTASASPELEKAGTPHPASYQVRNKKYGDLLRPENANGADGTPIVLYSAQPWKCMTWKLQPEGEMTFSLQNHFTSKTFTGETRTQAAPQAVVQVPFAKDSAERPAWRFARLADGTCKITEPKTGNALTAVKGVDGYSVRIVLQAWQDSDEQKWELIEIDPRKLTM